MNALEIAQKYYAAFNRQDWQGMLELVHPDIQHEPNEGEARHGKAAFTEFLKMMDTSYEEVLSEMVFFTEPSGKRISVEFVVNGIYKKGDDGFPEARGQRYVLPAAAFLEVTDGKISRVTTYYNLTNWISLVS
ncbi:nuclear transport factor 2 family protein [Dyadobacter tibetensis]|uniref:nuclear transport factor 2 family protein n=1 Tax=Dyadobacter tibetensis TaxID=1211851 RepID=UPI000471CAED|nr:nuclear transport factor 2 family protein [Dyadobacter tibetensis]